MSRPFRTTLECMPSEIISDICSYVGLVELSHLYAINNRNLQRKLVSPGCVPNVLVTAHSRKLLPETRYFLRNHSGLEELNVSEGDTFSVVNHGPSDDVIRITNPKSLRKLLLNQPIPLARDDTVFPLLERFPRLKHLQLLHLMRSGHDLIPTALSSLAKVLHMLEGLESLAMKQVIDFATIKLPSTLTSLDIMHADSDADTKMETLESIKNQCPNLKFVSIFFVGNMNAVPPNFNNAAMAGTSLREDPVAIFPFEDFTIMCDSNRFINPVRSIHMPHLKNLVFNVQMAPQSTLLLDLLKTDSLTSLSIGETLKTSPIINATVNMTPDIAKAFPASLTSLKLGNLVQFDLSSQSEFNLFSYLPRGLQHLAISQSLPSYEWKYLPATLEALKLHIDPYATHWLRQKEPETIALSSVLPCKGLKSFEARLALRSDSIYNLPSSLTRLSCILSDTWEIGHVIQLARHLPLASLSLDGNVRLTEGPVEGTLDVNLDQYAFECLGRDIKRRCWGYKWVVDVRSPKEGQVMNSTKKFVIPSSTTSFTAHMSQSVVPDYMSFHTANIRSGQGNQSLLPSLPPGRGIASVVDLMQVWSTLPNLTSLTFSSEGSHFPLESVLKKLSNLIHLNLGKSLLQNFSPAWLPRNLQSFTSFASVPFLTRKSIAFTTDDTLNDDQLPPGFMGVLQGPTTISPNFGGFLPQANMMPGYMIPGAFIPSPSTASMNAMGIPVQATLPPGFSPYASQPYAGIPSGHLSMNAMQPSSSMQADGQFTPKEELAEFPPNLTLLVIPKIALLENEHLTLPATLKTLSINTYEWKDNLVKETKSRLPNLTSFTVSDISICQASIPALAEHLDWDVLREGAKSLTTQNTAVLRIDKLELPKTLTSLNLSAMDEIMRVHEYASAQNSTVDDQDVPSTPRAYPAQDLLMSTLTNLSQLGRLPDTLTKLHIQVRSAYLQTTQVTLPRTLLDLSLGPLGIEYDPFEGIPASVTRLSLGFTCQSVCRFSQMRKIPPNLVYLRAMELLIFPATIELLPKSLTDIGISGCGGWRDVHIKQLQEHIQPNAKIWLSKAQISGSFLSSHLESLTRETIYSYTCEVLGTNVTCSSWTLSAALILPQNLTSLSCSTSKSLLLQAGIDPNANLRGTPDYYPMEMVEPDFDWASLLPLRNLNSLSLSTRNLTMDQVYCLPSSLTFLSLKMAMALDIPALWSALPRKLLHFQLDWVRQGHGTAIETELDGIPQNLQTLHIPVISPTENAIRSLPSSLTHLKIHHSPLPLIAIKKLHPQISDLDVVETAENQAFLPRMMSMSLRIE